MFPPVITIFLLTFIYLIQSIMIGNPTYIQQEHSQKNMIRLSKKNVSDCYFLLQIKALKILLYLTYSYAIPSPFRQDMYCVLFTLNKGHLIIQTYCMRLFLLVLAIAAISTATTDSTDKIWPKPVTFSSNPQGKTVKVSPCDVQYVIDASQQAQINTIIEWYLTKVFKCPRDRQAGQVSLNINVKNGDLLIPTDVNHETYSLSLQNHQDWELNADFYPGFLRGFETFSQLFEVNDQNKYEVAGLPILVEDAPSFKWRGLMIDTSRHFLPVSEILKAIDHMLYSKLNVLHWHIIDEDAFPMEVPEVPELSEFGHIGGIFSVSDIKTVIEYAKIRGIRVVPQIDSPAHTQSWGRSDKYKDITLTCNGIYMGQFDPTLDLTWEVVNDVMNYINKTFQDDYVHFGGDEVVEDCWGQRQSITDWMHVNNIANYSELSIYYRQQQKKAWRNISSSKKVIYWANEDIDLPMQDEDVIAWWGVSSNVGRMVGRKNEVILSNYDITYLDIGFGNFYGNVYGVYEDWRKMYSYEPRVPSVNVIGGEACMWSELTNKHTFEQKVIQRSTVIAERLWNVNVDINTEIKNIATRLTAQTQRLRERGFKVWPVTVGLCEQDMDICF